MDMSTNEWYVRTLYIPIFTLSEGICHFFNYSLVELIS